MATANRTTPRTIHENQSCENRASRGETGNGSGATGILALFATFLFGHSRANFTKPPPSNRKGQVRFR
jgi:hypothetical protein